ncbi:hypothetical protein [Diplocloster modestus]|uniref:LITAF domain-containing protein n=1 Tax=Diplocloster modestus TaxID=2850322 RepID=A0ABS6K1U7_9FIRM|nr:hypothetical protein [Diplocloster modestus]MBU9724432.1 hypothetical protein [Diplocloster modestus]
MKCPKCGSQNVIVQREQTASIGGSIHSFGKSGHSFLYWLLIGWWWWAIKVAMKFLLAVCTMGISLLFHRNKNKAGGRTISANKTFNKTVAVCQSCGHHWKV